LGQQYFLIGAAGLRLSEMIPVARAEAGKELEFLPSEPIAHAVLGAIAAVHDYDWKEADEQFKLAKLARTSESVSPSVHYMYAGHYLSPLGRFEEALQQAEKVIAQDPLNMLFRGRHLLILPFAEMYERAIVEAKRMLEFDEKQPGAHSLTALAHFFLGKLREAREWAEEAFRWAPLDHLATGLLAGLLRQSPQNQHAEKLLATLRGMPPLGIIIDHVVCSETDAAIDWYEHAIEQRQPFAAGWAFAGFFGALRSSPRWLRLAQMMNLPEAG
jgi:tetratricopeptide (TPR) repeat protein